jgi:hypothetical protein
MRREHHKRELLHATVNIELVSNALMAATASPIHRGMFTDNNHFNRKCELSVLVFMQDSGSRERM